MASHLRHYSGHFAKWSTALALVFFIFSQAYSSPDSKTKSAKAADFSLKDLQGHTVKLSHFKGQVILVNFWTTWCPPCRAEIPDFIATYEKYKKKGFTVIGISLDDATTSANKRQLVEFIKKAGVTYPILIGNRAVCNDYGGVYAIPTSFLIDSKGNIVKKYIGILKGETLEKDLLPLLKNKGNYKT